MAILQHVALLAILGPWGMNHSANVLIWNVAMGVEVFCLFWVHWMVVPAKYEPGRSSRIVSMFATMVMIAATILPFGERSSWWDTWPSFALYSAPRASARLMFHEQIGDFVGPVEFFDLAGKSLKDRRAPLYPSIRAINGLAEGFARSHSKGREVRFSIDRGLPPTSPFFRHPMKLTTSRRSPKPIVEMFEINPTAPFESLDEIRQHGDTFWLNAHPAH